MQVNTELIGFNFATIEITLIIIAFVFQNITVIMLSKFTQRTSNARSTVVTGGISVACICTTLIVQLIEIIYYVCN